MIDLNKKYTTRDGKQVKLYDIVNAENQKYPVIGAFYIDSDKRWKVDTWTLNGRNDVAGKSIFDLIEKSKYNFVKRLTCVTWDIEGDCQKLRHYSHSDNDKHYVFTDGKTSHTAHNDTVSFNYCKPYQPEPKPLQEGELVIVWDNTNDEELLDKYYVGRFISKNKCYYVTSTLDSNDLFKRNWDNCIRLNEFKL